MLPQSANAGPCPLSQTGQGGDFTLFRHLIELWDPRMGRLHSTLTGHEALVTVGAVSPDGTRLATASFDKTIRLWDLPEGRPGPVLRGHENYLRALAYSPDGRTIASSGSDCTVRVWDTENATSGRILGQHAGIVRALAFDSTGRHFVSASDDWTLKVWDLSSAGEPRSLTGIKNASSLAFSPDGLMLASSDEWGTVAIRDVAMVEASPAERGRCQGLGARIFARRPEARRGV